MTHLIFGIGGYELVFVLAIILMLFGSKNIPELARTFGRIMAQVKNASNDLKHEIQKGAEDSGVDKLSDSITKGIDQTRSQISDQVNSVANPFKENIDQLEDQIKDSTGPIKRRR